MPKYRVSYGFLYDVSQLGRVAAVVYGDHPTDLNDISGREEIETLDALPDAYSAFSQRIVDGIVDDEAALEGLLAGNRGHAGNVETKSEEDGVIHVPSEVVREYILALDDLAGRVTLSRREHEHLYKAFGNVIVTLGQPLHPTEEDFSMDMENVENLSEIVGDEALRLALSAYDEEDLD